eukprot:GFYU01000199.1.p1 GENE.GFYU01000199.1~~GFYU01000199.1.p1  ORF type:complete len:612 (+),score=214.11 GFYU01000199.1:191-1837(+)
MFVLVPLIVCLNNKEQALVRHCTRVYTINGPKVFMPPLFSSYTRRDVLTLEHNQYLLIRNEVTGERKVEAGPQSYFLGADEEVIERKHGVQLSNTEYAVIRNTSTGEKFHVKGPTLFFPTPTQELKSRSEGYQLSDVDYLHIQSEVTGNKSIVKGPRYYVPSEEEKILEKKKAISLLAHQFVRIIDSRTGVTRVIRGETMVLLEPDERVDGSVGEAINVDVSQAVLVRDKMTGQLSLITEHQSFVPKANEEVEDIRELIRLEDYHTAVVKNNNDGTLIYKKGPDTFFLGPHCDLLKMRWSTGLHKDRRDLVISLFDARPKFMWYEFEARTQDNVEVVVGITFFWCVEDVRRMVETTDDAPGDICSHARSVIIQAVSKVNFEDFLQNFNSTVQSAVMNEVDTFYTTRGLKIFETEVRSITCKDEKTQLILQEIIQEHTNRINRLLKQESENEVNIRKFEGDLETEKMKEQLLDIRQNLVKKEGNMEGQREAMRIKAFMEGLGGVINKEDTRIAIFNALRKAETLEHLSQGKAQLFFTPSDVDLKINAGS